MEMNLNFFRIDKLITIQSFECSHDFPLQKLPHGSWIFLFVEKGTAEISTGDETFIFHKDEIAFYQTNHLLPLNLNYPATARIIVAAFQTNSSEMLFFQGKTFQSDERERSILAELLSESSFLFPQETTCASAKDFPFATEQMVHLHLQHLFIHLMRRYAVVAENTFTPPAKKDSEIFKRVTYYMKNNLSAHLTIDQLCHENTIGRAHLQKIFHTESGCGVIEYFLNLKIDTAKDLIQNSEMSFTQISEQLGYSSVHYFSRQFKKLTGMTPSEYASSVKL